jgi:hypothetical protein
MVETSSLVLRACLALHTRRAKDRNAKYLAKKEQEKYTAV